jgi:hypothetical protein
VCSFGYTIQPENGAGARFSEDRIAVIENLLGNAEQAAFALVNGHGLQVRRRLLSLPSHVAWRCPAWRRCSGAAPHRPRRPRRCPLLLNPAVLATMLTRGSLRARVFDAV